MTSNSCTTQNRIDQKYISEEKLVNAVGENAKK